MFITTSKKKVFFIVATCVLLVAFVVGAKHISHLVQRLDLMASNPNPLLRHFVPTWRSLKKLIDTPYVVASLFYTSKLPVYELELSEADSVRLLANLPDYPKDNRLFDEYKESVKARFRYGEYVTDDADVRYRGLTPNHWNALKKSWQVNVPDTMPLNNQTSLRFIIPSDRGWVQPFLWHSIGDKLGLINHDVAPVQMRVNNEDIGMYLLFEGWETPLLASQGKMPGNIFSDRSINIRTSSQKVIPDLLRPDQIFQWYERSNEDISAENYPQLMELLWLTAQAPQDEFEQKIGEILDMETFLTWTFTSILSGNFHQNNSENLHFYANPDTKKLEIIQFDITVTKIQPTIDLKDNRLVSRVLTSPIYRAQFEEIARGYVSNRKNLEEDLALYDTMAKRIEPEVYQDTTKLETSWEVIQKIREDRVAYEYNFLQLLSRLENGGALSYAFAEETYPLVT